MFFKEYFISIADVLEAQFAGMQRRGQNPIDKGELCEIFIRNLLNDLFNDHFRIFRGGKIINIDNKESSQIDIVLTAKNSIKIFGDKGIYPIESVYGVFSITATLDHPKLFSKERGIIEELKSIPKDNPQFEYLNFISIPDLENKMQDYWQKVFPFKCVFGFTGDINKNWENELNQMVAENRDIKSSLPDLIVVNKKGLIEKLNGPSLSTSGAMIENDFHFASFETHRNYGVPITKMASKLFSLSDWQNKMAVKYDKYFNKDLL